MDDPRPPKAPLLVSLASLAFVSLGLPDGLLGVAWPSIRATFALPLDALGALLVAFTSGYVASSFWAGWALARLGLGSLLAVSTLLTAVSLLGYAGAPAWRVMVPLATVAGLGAGAIDTGVNAYASLHLGPRLMNWLHACFGLGAASGPLIMTAVLGAGRPWQHGYALVGGAQLALAGAFALSAPTWTRAASANTGSVAARTAGLPSRGRAASWLGALTFFAYTGLEAGFGVWSYTLLTEGRGMAAREAGLCVSVFWGGLTGGRLMGAFLADSVRVTRVLRGCLLAISAAAALLAANLSNAVSFAAVALAGVACGPVFPSFMSTTPARVGEENVPATVGLQIAGAALGAALVPAAMGIVAGRAGIESVCYMLLALGILVLGVLDKALAP